MRGNVVRSCQREHRSKSLVGLSVSVVNIL